MVTQSAAAEEAAALLRAWVEGAPVVEPLGAASASLHDTLTAVLVRRDAALAALLDLIPVRYQVRVCEGGGPENIEASLAVSLVKLVDAVAGRGHP